MAAMIDTVKQRLRNSTDFGFYYENLCALQNSCPLGTITANLDEYIVDCNTDRIRQNDWTPIWNALKINKSLKTIAFRSYWQQTLFPENEFSEQRLMALKKKAPPIRSKDTTYKLCRSLKECLCVTESLTCLVLQGILLREKDLSCIAKGITKNHTLQQLSLEFCQIGDRGLEVLCNAIKGSRSIVSVNFTGCCLSWRGAETLAKIIRFQATRRHGAAWQDSLRYRRPDLDRMSGLRRITVCKNPLMSDKGVEFIAETLKDDLWVKALDLQQCGITTAGALALQSVLQFNTTITVLDLRLNPLIDRHVMSALMEQIIINSDEQETEYPWIVIEEPKPGRIRPLKKGVKSSSRPRTVSTAYGRKTTRSGSQGTRSKSASIGSPVVKTTKKPGVGFVPWRTAARVGKNRHKLDRKPDDNQPYKVKTKKKKKQLEFEEPKAISSPVESDDDDDELTTPRHQHYDSDEPRSMDDNPRELKIEVEFLQRRLDEESKARASADTRVLELQVENRRLQQELRLLKVKRRSFDGKIPLATLQAPADDTGREKGQNGRTLLDDERFLESIEASFKQFYQFLDLLKGKGYGDLVRALQENGFPVSPQSLIPPTETTTSRDNHHSNAS